MIERMQQWAMERGYQVAWGPGSVVERVRREIEARRSGAEIDGRFFEHELKAVVDFQDSAEGRSILILSMPRPAHVIHFEVDGQDIEALLPPTYFRYRATFEDVRLDLAKNGLPDVKLEYLAAPLKATASRLGLIQYGRNNISYASTLGSYIQLCGFRVDASLPQGEETDASLLDQCETCGICSRFCPTEAISEDRILIHAERCLTFLNENEGDWPGWIDSQAHNCLLGCLECQRVCPVNPPLQVEDTGLAFSAAETRWMLSIGSTDSERAETGVRAKLAWLGQPNVESVLGRNLRALLQSQNRLQRASFP